MTDLAMIFVGGLLGSSHCVGMCGPIVVAIGAPAPNWTGNLRRQLAYSIGRIFTYAVMGAMAGYAGMRMAGRMPTMVNMQAVLAIVAGTLLIFQGLLSAGLISLPRQKHFPGCMASGLLATFLRHRQLHGVFLAGVLSGFLPCGLVYAYVALAASSGSLLGGLTRMAAFGAGTVPLLVMVGAGGSLLGLTSRRRALRVAACFVVAMGTVSLLRGTGYIGWSDGELVSGCPMCHVQKAELPGETPRPTAMIE